MVRAKKGRKAATSDWMEIERQRGISVTSSVMSFPHDGHHMNLVDTPGHEDFCEDTFRALAAVDSAVVLIDGAKGVEPQTLRLMEVCRHAQDAGDHLHQQVRPRHPRSAGTLRRDRAVLGTALRSLHRAVRFRRELSRRVFSWPTKPSIRSPSATAGRGGSHRTGNPSLRPGQRRAGPAGRRARSGQPHARVGGICHRARCRGFDRDAYLQGQQTPVFFGSALHLFGVKHLLDALVGIAPAPSRRASDKREVMADEDAFTGFVFKIQANMDPKHRDRMAFVRVCSGKFVRGEKVTHVTAGARSAWPLPPPLSPKTDRWWMKPFPATSWASTIRACSASATR
jgi:peptide chain release factor 3